MNKLDKLENLLKIVQDSVTQEEFLKSFQSVIDLVLKIGKDLKDRNEKMSKEMMDLCDTLAKNLEELNKQKLSSVCLSMDNKMAEAQIGINKLLKEQEAGMNFIRDKVRKIKEGVDGKDGRDAPPAKDGKDGSPDTAQQIRDKLESLDEDNQLRIESIYKLHEELNAFKNRPARVGGGFSKIAMDSHLVDDETPTGLINSANTAFVLANAPNPLSSLKVYVNGQRMRLTEDYTFSVKTITFLIAPPTGSILLADYRI